MSSPDDSYAPPPPPPPPQRDSSSTASLSKREKGRFKKLLKRAKNFQPDRQVSGISSAEDWTELQALLVRSSSSTANNQQQQGGARNDSSNSNEIMLLGPSVASRAGCSRSSPVDAADHRDTLFRLLAVPEKKGGGDEDGVGEVSGGGREGAATAEGGRNSAECNHHHKRKREIGNGDDNSNNKRVHTPSSSSPRWPHWACVHNPAAVESAAVMELHVRDASEMKALVSAVEALFAATTAKSPQRRSRTCHTVPTTWFPNLHHPQSVSSALMYSMTNSSKNNKRPSNTISPTNLRELYEKLVPLALTEDEQKAEGYPVILLLEGADQAAVEDGEDGRLKRAQVAVSSPHDDPRLPRFVSTTAHRQGTALVTPTSGSTSCNDTADSATNEEKKELSGESSNTRRIFALDCEMVQTTIGSELARATLVQLVGLHEEQDGNNKDIRLETLVCFDRLVQPEHPVVDYLTMYSGITKERLQEAQDQDELYSLKQIQFQMLNWIRPGDILIGHSLENDVVAMRCHHARLVDTSILFRPVGAKFKYSLRHLSVSLLRKTIRQQQHRSGGEMGGHCSREDAEAALELAVRRAWNGPSFGAPLKRRKTHSNQLMQLASSTANAPVVAIGPSEWLQQHVLQPPSSIHALACESIDDRNGKAVTAWLSESSQRRRRSARLVWSHWKHQNDNFEKFIKLLKDLLTKISPTTIVLLAIQVGHDETAKITAERRARMKPRATMAWTEQEQTKWLKRVHACRNGAVMWIGTKQQA